MIDKARILIVEDETIVSLHLKRSLEKLGYRVCGSLSTGEKAIEHVSKDAPDLILMDIMLAGEVDGISAAETIRKNFNIPIIYLSAYTDDESVKRAVNTSPQSYLTKPFRDDDLKTNIELALVSYKHNEKRDSDFQWIFEILNSTNTPLFGFNNLGKIQIATKSLSKYCDTNISKLLGMPFDEALKIYNTNDEIITRTFMESQAEKNSLFFGAVKLQILDGEKHPFSAYFHPLVNKKAETIGSVLLLKKIGEEKIEWIKDENLNRHLCDIINFIEKPSFDIEICPWCKKIYDSENNEWVNVELFIRNKSIEDTSHCACPKCTDALGLDLNFLKKKWLH